MAASDPGGCAASVTKSGASAQPKKAQSTSRPATMRPAATKTRSLRRCFWGRYGLRPMAEHYVPPMETLHVERDDGIVTVTLDKPGKKNAIDPGQWAELSTIRDENRSEAHQ